MKTAKTLQEFQQQARKLSKLDTLPHDDHYFCVSMIHVRRITLTGKKQLEAIAKKYL